MVSFLLNIASVAIFATLVQADRKCDISGSYDVVENWGTTGEVDVVSVFSSKGGSASFQCFDAPASHNGGPHFDLLEEILPTPAVFLPTTHQADCFSGIAASVPAMVADKHDFPTDIRVENFEMPQICTTSTLDKAGVDRFGSSWSFLSSDLKKVANDMYGVPFPSRFDGLAPPDFEDFCHFLMFHMHLDSDECFVYSSVVANGGSHNACAQMCGYEAMPGTLYMYYNYNFPVVETAEEAAAAGNVRTRALRRGFKKETYSGWDDVVGPPSIILQKA